MLLIDYKNKFWSKANRKKDNIINISRDIISWHLKNNLETLFCYRLKMYYIKKKKYWRSASFQIQFVDLCSSTGHELFVCGQNQGME